MVPEAKDVEALLLKTKNFRRKPGDVPYPVEHSSAMSVYDVWDNMFFRSHCRDLTMCQFDRPPAVILDLGCGSGYWIVEAAKQWKASTIVGFDLKAAQPKLSAFRQYRDIAHRVKWVHGNLLDGLPFPPSSFDFVRIVNIGLGVPEDEWQYVFEEVARVMKPGAAIEVIEEDPIFPCVQRPSFLHHGRLQLRPIAIDVPPLESPPSSAYSYKSSLTFASDSSITLFDDRFESPSPASPQARSTSSSPAISNRTPSLLQIPLTSQPDVATPDPQDHSKLKAAWDAMLSSRFIASNLSAVLPLYFSSLFTDVQIHRPFKIPLPPNSDHVPHGPREPSFAESFSCFTTSNDPPSKTDREKDSNSADEMSPSYGSTWHNMHLAKTVNTIKGCKAAIWQEYKQLYATGFKPMAARTSAAGARPGVEAALREAFEEQWSAWENDMLDRIGLRGSMMSALGWAEPSGDNPDWRVWRSHVDKVAATNELPSPDSIYGPKKDPDLCRSVRGFVGWKP